MVTLIYVVGFFLLAGILNFDLLELAIRRTILVCILVIAGILLAIPYFLYGLYEGYTRVPIQTRRQRSATRLQHINSIIVKLWTIPVKTLLIEPHIRKAVNDGLRDGVNMHSWFKRSQLNPNHPFTVVTPFKSFLRGTLYVGYKGYMRGVHQKPKQPKDFTMWDVLP